MKAVLIIDIDEIENCNVEVYVYKNNKPYKNFNYIKLKPLPQKKNIDLAEWCDYGGGWNCGWNACIDEILGEEQ